MNTKPYGYALLPEAKAIADPQSAPLPTHAADEFERSGPMRPGKGSEVPLRTYGSDPILSAIERLEEPRIVDALRDAMLLRALADSPALRSEPDVGQWLQDLAEKLERRAA